MPRSAPVLHPLCTRSAPSGAPSAQAPLTPSALCVCTGLRQQRACLRRRRAGEAHHRPRVAQHAGITRPARRGRGIRRGGAAARLAGCRGAAWRRRGRGACSGAGGLGTARHRHVGSMTCGYPLTLLYERTAKRARAIRIRSGRRIHFVGLRRFHSLSVFLSVMFVNRNGGRHIIVGEYCNTAARPCSALPQSQIRARICITRQPRATRRARSGSSKQTRRSILKLCATGQRWGQARSQLGGGADHGGGP